MVFENMFNFDLKKSKKWFDFLVWSTDIYVTSFKSKARKGWSKSL